MEAKWKICHCTPHDFLADKPNRLTDREWQDLVKFWILKSIRSRSHQKAKLTMARKNVPCCGAETKSSYPGLCYNSKYYKNT
ncbi:hypothetical protein MKX03_025556 [Papaver bracteatum]|nr:hypothetical protein MKX03_025556 [Papaver bracteatum]